MMHDVNNDCIPPNLKDLFLPQRKYVPTIHDLLYLIIFIYKDQGWR